MSHASGLIAHVSHVTSLDCTHVSHAELLFFQYEEGDKDSASKLFSVPDFIGFACREVASRIRGAVAAVPFEQFHKFSTEIIRAGVFGKNKDGSFKEELVFKANNLVSLTEREKMKV